MITLHLNQQMVKRLLQKYAVIAVTISLIVGAAGGYFLYRSQGVSYSATGEMVQNDNNYGMISTYKQFIDSAKFKKILNSKIKSGQWKSYRDAKNYQLSITTEDSSPFFVVHATTSNNAYTKYLTMLAMQTFITSIGRYLARTNISIVSNSPTPIQNNMYGKYVKKGVLIFLLSLIIILMFDYRREYFNGKVNDEDFLNDVFQISKLGNVDMARLQNKEG